MPPAELVCLGMSVFVIIKSMTLNTIMNKQQYKKALLVGETRLCESTL